MLLGCELLAVKARIVDFVQKSWDTNWFGDATEYCLSPGSSFDRLSINVLSYPVTSKWAYFKTPIEENNFDVISKHLAIKGVASINIVATAEGGYNYTLAKNKLLESLNLTIQAAQKAGVKARMAIATGVYSKHLYVEFDKDLNETSQKLVFVLVIKNTKK